MTDARYRLRAGDLLDADVDGFLGSPGDPLDAIYADPPWGDGMMKSFATMMRKQVGTAPKPAAYQDFIDRIFGLAATHLKPSGWLLIEAGLRWTDALKADFARFGYERVSSFTVPYGASVSSVVVASPSGQPYPVNLEGLRGVHLVSAALSVLEPGATVFDPCCGLGTTAKVCIDRKFRFVGNELNPARLARTEALLRAAYG